MLFSAARCNRLWARRRLVANSPAMAAAPSANGSAMTVPATAAESSASKRTIQPGPKMRKVRKPAAKPIAPVKTTSGQLRIAFERV